MFKGVAVSKNFLYGVDVIYDIKFIIKMIRKSVNSLNLNEIVL